MAAKLKTRPGSDDAGLVAGLGRRWRADGLPVDRLILHRRTLHPDIVARHVAWAPLEPVEIYDRDHGLETSASFRASPLHAVMESGIAQVIRLDQDMPPSWTQTELFRGRGLRVLLILPVQGCGVASALSIATREIRGFHPQARKKMEDAVGSPRR